MLCFACTQDVFALCVRRTSISGTFTICSQYDCTLALDDSTCGIIASILACVQRHKSQIELHGGSERIGGELQSLARHSVVILPRDAHKSAVHGLILSGATPCFLAPLRHLQSGISLGICKEDLKDALERYGDEVRDVLDRRNTNAARISPTVRHQRSRATSFLTACYVMFPQQESGHAVSVCSSPGNRQDRVYSSTSSVRNIVLSVLQVQVTTTVGTTHRLQVCIFADISQVVWAMLGDRRTFASSVLEASS